MYRSFEFPHDYRGAELRDPLYKVNILYASIYFKYGGVPFNKGLRIKIYTTPNAITRRFMDVLPFGMEKFGNFTTQITIIHMCHNISSIVVHTL